MSPSDDQVAPLLAYSRDGDPSGQPVLMGSSLGTTRQMWAANVEALAEFDLIRFDHLGHGQSPVPPGPYSIEQLGGAVLSLMDSLQIDQAAYVGLSLGGAIGQWLAIHAPQRINSLTLMCTAAYFPTPESWQERAASVRTAGTATLADAAMERWFTADYRRNNQEDVARWVDMVSRTPDEGYAGCCGALAGFDVRDELTAIAAPTLAIAGAEDPSTTVESLTFIADRIEGAQLEVIADAAHLANVEQPEAVNAALRSHLAGDRR